MINKSETNTEQTVNADELTKEFGVIKEKVKKYPYFIAEEGNIVAVLMDYNHYEELYRRISALEEKEGDRILSKRMERISEDPSKTIPWRKVRRLL